MAELFDSINDLNKGGSKRFRSLAAAQSPKSDAVKEEAALKDEPDYGDDGDDDEGSGDENYPDEPEAEAVKLENSEEGKKKKRPSMAELFDSINDLNKGGSKRFRSLAAAQSPKSDAVKEEEALKDEPDYGDDGDDDEGSGEEDYSDDGPEAEAVKLEDSERG